jgi:hypothetical protein
MPKQEGIDAIGPEVARGYQKIFILGHLSYRQLQTLSDAEGIQIGQSTLIRKNPTVPSLPACDWGQRPVLERILPLRRWR